MEISKIVTKYSIPSTLKIEKSGYGLINDTFLVTATDRRYILQKLNPIYGKEVVEDLDLISCFIDDKDLVVPKVIRTSDGRKFVDDGGKIWRLLSYIEGRVFEKINSAEIAYETGKILGKFHSIMMGCKHKFRNQQQTVHDFGKIFNSLVKTEIENIGLPLKEFLTTQARELSLNLTLPLDKIFIVHGDPKISNFIFDKVEPRVIGLIDLDGCNLDCLLLELGDAFRSWCGGFEDDPANFFSLEFFKASLSGYCGSCSDLLVYGESSLIWSISDAIKLVTLELASRFLIDFQRDKYFGWDKRRYQTRKEHNLARVNGQISLYKDVQAKEKEIFEIIRNI